MAETDKGNFSSSVLFVTIKNVIQQGPDIPLFLIDHNRINRQFLMKSLVRTELPPPEQTNQLSSLSVFLLGGEAGLTISEHKATKEGEDTKAGTRNKGRTQISLGNRSLRYNTDIRVSETSTLIETQLVKN